MTEYHRFGKKSLYALFNVMTVLASRCQHFLPVPANPSLQQSNAETMVAQQLIIKFRSNSISCDAAGIAQLSLVTRVPLEYVRRMSGDACVIRQLADETNNFLQGKKLLSQQPSVEWVELDGKKKAL